MSDMKSMAKSFGENLKELMVSRRITQRELSEALDVPVKTVQEWVGSGARTPRNLDSLKKLANYFGCSLHFLLYGEEDPRSSLGAILDKSEIHSGLYEITIKKVVKKL